MIFDRREKWFNRRLDQWLSDTIQEARRDAVSLQQIYGTLTDDFEVSTDDFDEVLFYVLEAIFKSGICPVIQSAGCGWSKDQAFAGVSEMSARKIIAAVKTDPELVTFAGIWLGRPE